MTKRRKSTTAAKPEIGDFVLIGRPGVSMPADWFLVRVLWTDGTEMLTEHECPSTHHMQRNVLSVDEARAIGSISDLGDFKGRMRVVMKEYTDRIRAAESALGDARQALWDQLDKIGASACRLAAIHPPGDL